MLLEQYKFEDSLLIATKKCTHERNMHYKTGLATWLVHNNVTMCIQTGGQNKQKLFILYAYLKEVLVVAIIVLPGSWIYPQFVDFGGRKLSVDESRPKVEFCGFFSNFSQLRLSVIK